MTQTNEPEQFTWYGGTLDQPPSAPIQEPPSRRSQSRTVGRRGELVVTAGVAAVLASALTAGALVAFDGSGGSTSAIAATTRSNAAGTGVGPVDGRVVDWSKVAEAVQPSVVAISASSQQGGGQGSGVLLDDAGRVLTNNHVAASAGVGGRLTVTLADGRSFEAGVVGTDPSTDLAVIAMRGATKLTPASLGDSDAVTVGEPVMALGNPLGLAGTVTTGIVSALDRPVRTANEPSTGGAASGADVVVTNAIQTDAAVNPGNSGGALVDASGRVVGIPSSIASLGQSSSGAQPGSIGLGFAIPINEAKSISDQLVKAGKAEHPYLGVELSDGVVTQGAARRSAARIGAVTPGTPAERAGLKPGDAVLAVNGEPVNSSESLIAQIRERRVGDPVSLTIARQGKEQQVSLTLTRRP
jgi:putative serine protease PepD